MQKLFNNMSKKSGFTLIEILVATTILVIAMAAIYVSFRGGLTSWTKGTARMERYLNARAALDMMSREIRAAFIYTTNNEFFYGRIDSLNFVAVIGPVGAITDLYTIRYYHSGREIFRADEPGVDSDIRVVYGTPHSFPLVSNITSLTFQYHDGSNWLATWDSTPGGTEVGRLPRAVEITITVQDELRPEIAPEFSTIVYLPASR